MFDTVTSELPPGLADHQPGPELAVALAGADLGALSGHDRVVVLQALHRQVAHYQALESAAVAAVHGAVAAEDDDPESSFEAAAAAIRLALRLTRHAANVRLESALDLAHRLPAVSAAWVAGRIDERRAPSSAAAPCTSTPTGAGQSPTWWWRRRPGSPPGELRERLRELCVVADPDDAERRYHQAVGERRVVAEPTVDGTANLVGVDLPPHEAAAALQYVNQVARSLETGGETRSMDQLRADVYVDLLTGRTPSSAGTRPPPGTGGTVELRVDLTTLAGLDDRPGDLGGYGPVVADVARQIADASPGAEWRYVVCDPDSGMPIHVGTTRRRPTAAQRRQVEARSPRCVFPGCRAPAAACHLDHRVAWVESQVTCSGCLEPLCPGDHRIRHLPGWMYQLLRDGDHLWTTRLGPTHTTSGRSP